MDWIRMGGARYPSLDRLGTLSEVERATRLSGLRTSRPTLGIVVSQLLARDGAGQPGVTDPAAVLDGEIGHRAQVE